MATLCLVLLVEELYPGRTTNCLQAIWTAYSHEHKRIRNFEIELVIRQLIANKKC